MNYKDHQTRRLNAWVWDLAAPSPPIDSFSFVSKMKTRVPGLLAFQNIYKNWMICLQCHESYRMLYLQRALILFNDNLAQTFNNLNLRGLLIVALLGASPCEGHTLVCLLESVSPEAKPGRAGTGCVFQLVCSAAYFSALICITFSLLAKLWP